MIFLPFKRRPAPPPSLDCSNPPLYPTPHPRHSSPRSSAPLHVPLQHMPLSIYRLNSAHVELSSETCTWSPGVGHKAHQGLLRRHATALTHVAHLSSLLNPEACGLSRRAQSAQGGGGGNRIQVSYTKVQVEPVVHVPCVTPPPPKSYWMEPTQRHATSKRSGKEGRCQWACERRTARGRTSGGGGGVWGVFPTFLRGIPRLRLSVRNVHRLRGAATRSPLGDNNIRPQSAHRLTYSPPPPPKRTQFLTCSRSRWRHGATATSINGVRFRQRRGPCHKDCGHGGPQLQPHRSSPLHDGRGDEQVSPGATLEPLALGPRLEWEGCAGVVPDSRCRGGGGDARNSKAFYGNPVVTAWRWYLSPRGCCFLFGAPTHRSSSRCTLL